MQAAHFRPAPIVGLILGVPLLLFSLSASIAIGTAAIDPATVYAALTGFDGSPEHLIIQTVRLPRALIAAMVGASLAVAGAIMQALTRNPLAAPGILGINAGAALLVVVATFLLRANDLTVYTWCAFLGAGLAAAVVAFLGSLGRGGMTPLKLSVAGAAMTALLSSLTQAVLVLNERSLDELRFWLAGSIAGRDFGLFVQVLPYMLVGLAGAFILGRQITTLGLGEDVARGLGQRTTMVKAAAAAVVILLAGSAVAVAGPIGFVGLAVPHLARSLVGQDYRWVLPYAALQGAILLLLADIGARFVIHPEEVPVGVMTALIGAPFFIYLARRQVRRVITA